MIFETFGAVGKAASFALDKVAAAFSRRLDSGLQGKQEFFALLNSTLIGGVAEIAGAVAILGPRADPMRLVSE